jgi:hypothetical protein
MEQVKSKALPIERAKFIPNFGYVPFLYFQHYYVVFIIVSFTFKDFLYDNIYKKIYDKIDAFFYGNEKNDKDKDKEKEKDKEKANPNQSLITISKSFIALLPILPLIYYDFFYKSFSLHNMGLLNDSYNRYVSTILRLFGSYVIIQVAAQDLGIKTGTVQSDFTKLSLMQVVLFAGCAFAITQDRSEALLAALIYFQLKYFGSNVTKDVCFD